MTLLRNLSSLFSLVVFASEVSAFFHKKTVNSIEDNSVWQYTLDDFKHVKASLLSEEFSMTLGYNMTLSAIEEVANDVITNIKIIEIEKGFFDPSTFIPSHHMFDKLDDIRSSQLFGIIQSMPKGGILHAHDTALGSTQIFIDLTYKPNCWICFHDELFRLELLRDNVQYVELRTSLREVICIIY